MQIGDLQSGSARLHLALKTLRLRWEETKEQWGDKTRVAFEENHLAEIDAVIGSTLEAVGRMGEMLGRAQRDCSEDQGLVL